MAERETKTRVQISLVDPPNRKIQAKLRDGATIDIVVWEVSNTFRWPVENEVWAVRKEKNNWMLVSPLADPTKDFQIEDMEAGDTKIGDGGTLHIHADDIKLYDGSSMKTYSTVIGDGSRTAFIINHGFNTRKVFVEVYGNADPYATVYPTIERPTETQVVLRFLAAPGVSEYTVLVRS